jgi:hypothetical protein
MGKKIAKQHILVYPFYTRIQNMTDVAFTQQETGLLNKGLQYNFYYKYKKWL